MFDTVFYIGVLLFGGDLKALEDDRYLIREGATQRLLSYAPLSYAAALSANDSKDPEVRFRSRQVAIRCEEIAAPLTALRSVARAVVLIYEPGRDWKVSRERAEWLYHNDEVLEAAVMTIAEWARLAPKESCPYYRSLQKDENFQYRPSDMVEFVELARRRSRGIMH